MGSCTWVSPNLISFRLKCVQRLQNVDSQTDYMEICFILGINYSFSQTFLIVEDLINIEFNYCMKI